MRCTHQVCQKVFFFSNRVLTSENAKVQVGAINTDFIGQHVKDIFSVTPIEYLKNIKLHGSLLEDSPPDIVSSIYAEFIVDRKESLEAFQGIQGCKALVLGNLLDGHEFLINLSVAKKVEADIVVVNSIDGSVADSDDEELRGPCNFPKARTPDM